MRGVHRSPTLAVVVAILLTACIGVRSDGGAGGTTSTSTRSSSATAPEQSASEASVAPPTEPASRTQVPSTTAALESMRQSVATAQFSVYADVPDTIIESVADVATNDDGTTAFFAGRLRAGPGRPLLATVWTTDGKTRTGTITLDLGGADESWASGIATRGDEVLVAGTTRTGARTNGVIWRSDDDGATFGPPQVIDDAVTELSDIAFGGQRLVAVGAIRPAGQRSTPVVLAGVADAWRRAVLAGPDQRTVRSVTVSGEVAVVTGSAEVDGDETALIWHSADGGLTFGPIEFAQRYAEVGTVNFHEGTYLTSARGKDDKPMVILTSPEGVAWTPTEVTLTDDGDDYPSQHEGGERVVVASDGNYITEVGSGFGYIGRIAADGRGAAVGIYEGRAQTDIDLIPFRLGRTVSVVTNTERSFAIFTESQNGWKPTSSATSEGPSVVNVEMYQVGEVAAKVTAYPKTSADGTRRAPSDDWSRFDGDQFQKATDLPGIPTALAANDTTEVAIRWGSIDPGDDEFDGPHGGSIAWTRQLPDGEWSDRQLILRGPGGDYLRDIDRVGPGFVAVGSRSEAGADQSYTSSAAVVEYRNGRWATATLPALAGTSSGLDDVVGSVDGTALAIGFTDDPALSGPLALARDTDGTWTRVELPVRDRGASVVSATFADGRYELLVVDAGAHAVLTSSDGKVFERMDLKFDDPFLVDPAAIVRVGNAVYVVGVSGMEGARTLAVWQLANDGSLSPLDVGGDHPIGEVYVDSVSARGADVWVGGRTSNLGVVWVLAFPNAPVTNVPSTSAATPAPPATALAPTTAPPAPSPPAPTAPPPTSSG